jgi:hypothetical protein
LAALTALISAVTAITNANCDICPLSPAQTPTAETCHQDQGADDRSKQFVHRPIAALSRHAVLDVLRGAFDNDDCVVDNNPDREQQREQCRQVHGIASAAMPTKLMIVTGTVVAGNQGRAVLQEPE